MGLIGKIFGQAATTKALGDAATGVAEVFLPNATKKMQAAHEAYIAALDEHGEEFKYVSLGFFDRFVNGLNRLPRPMLALGTLGLFIYAMVDPVKFAERMIGLNYVPEPLWWLLAAIVGFYFGAREAHYFRAKPGQIPAPGNAPTAAGDDNRALEELRRTRDRD
ncbi:MAG: holin family protein [Albidovulum sp.]